VEYPIVQLKPDKDHSVIRKHPWLFSGAIHRVIGNPTSGSPVAVMNCLDEFLAWGTFSESSKIQVRIWSWEENQRIDPSLIYLLIKQALDIRSKLVAPSTTNAYRLIHGESDGIPGLIVDQYADYLVIQSLSGGIEYWLKDIVAILAEITNCSGIYDRSDVEIRALEGLSLRKGVLFGREPPENIEIFEGESRFLVDVKSGQKTGFYLDQRENRKILKKFAKNREILDCFCYTGGFTINALQGGGKKITVIDSSNKALGLCQKNIALNGYSASNVEFQEGDVSRLLRFYRDRRQFFDLIILDPPKFAQSASQVEKASRGYKDINLLALKLLRPGGLLFTFSCSGNIDRSLFQKIIAGAALDAGGSVKILRYFHQAPDHLVSLNFPEGEYLKGFLLSRDILE
jgi:23S rRNA (cytosine1962-C5)-methyltransferase